MSEELDLRARGERLRVARKRRGWSQEVLAREAGVDQTEVSKMELGKLPGLSYMDRICHALLVPRHWLEWGDGVPPWEEPTERPQAREPALPYLPEGLPWDQAVREINWSLTFENARLRAEIAALRDAIGPAAAAAPPSPPAGPTPDPSAIAAERASREREAERRLDQSAEGDRDRRHG